ncbi:MAG: formyltransferase family protein [Verrucomicrobiota bacterium]
MGTLLSTLEEEEDLNWRLRLVQPGRVFASVAGARWGELILPAAAERRAAMPEAMRVVMFASFEYGYLALEAARAFAQRFPEKLFLAALVTDDPVNPEARIGLKKRIWKYLGTGERVHVETAVVDSALAGGMDVFTGEVKVDGFRQRLGTWRPDAIINCVFGQVIDAPIIQAPPLGIYNFHPSDLAHGHGAGHSPYEDLVARGATETVWSIHHVTEVVDGGAVVGHSPPINVAHPDGTLPANPLLLYDKLMDPVGWLMLRLLSALTDRYAAGATGPIQKLDFESGMPPGLRARIAAPQVATEHQDVLPVLGEEERATLGLA